MTIHELKCWPDFFDAVKRGDKTFEIRKNDRGFQTGDRLVLRKFNPETCRYLGPSNRTVADLERADTITTRVTYVLSDWGLERGYVCMAIEVEREPAQEGGEQ